MIFLKFIYFIILFYFIFWVRWVFVAASGLFSGCGERGLLFCCGVRAPHWGGFSLRSTGSRRAGFSSCGSRALERRLSSCGARA